MRRITPERPAWELQEIGAGVVFFAAATWLLVDATLAAPEEAPSLAPLLPMSAATLWYVAVEHARARRGA